MALAYANPGTGPISGGIGWVDFGNLVLNPGGSVIGVTGTLMDGTIVTFDISSDVGSQRIFTAIQTPTFGGAAFGTLGYNGIVGNVALNSNLVFAPTVATLNISNITLIDSGGNPVTDYRVVVADAEETGSNEEWVFDTDGGNWETLTTLGAPLQTISGIGSQTVTITGVIGSKGAYVVMSQSPTALEFINNITTNGGGQEAVAIGFIITKVIVLKNIEGRINPTDQFTLDINGIPSSQVTTTGVANGIQNEFASVVAIDGNSYTINETM